MISLSVQALTKTYNRKPIFTDLSFEHTDGILGVSGANGSGKSTLLRCLAYLTRAQKGSFKWIDKEIEIPKDEIKKTIGADSLHQFV